MFKTRQQKAIYLILVLLLVILFMMQLFGGRLDFILHETYSISTDTLREHAKDFSLEGDGFVAQSNDPWFEIEIPRGRYGRLMVDVASMNKSSTGCQVYYCLTDNGAFSEEQSVSQILTQRKNIIPLPKQEIDRLRLDLTSEAGVSIELNGIKLVEANSVFNPIGCIGVLGALLIALLLFVPVSTLLAKMLTISRPRILTEGFWTDKKVNRTKYICALCVFLLCFVMLMACVNDFFFDSDEGEIYSKALAITHGQLLYRDFSSQHMPLMYYIAAMFNLFGASTVAQFRICFYVLFSLLWAMNVIWYWDKTNRIALILPPLLYILQVKFIYLGTAVLSEHAQATGMAILFFELVSFYEHNKLDWGNYARISLAVFLSFGSAFTSIFPIFFLALTVLALEIKYYVRQDEIGKRAWRRGILRKYLLLVLVVFIPFIVLFIYYGITKSIEGFYYWAYKFNVTIYANYQPTGGSRIKALFNGFQYLLEPLKTIFGDKGEKMRAILTLGSLGSLFLVGILSKSVILPVGLLLMVNGCETRGSIDSFHSMHAVMLQGCILSYALGLLTARIRQFWLRYIAWALMIVAVLFPYRKNLLELKNICVTGDAAKSIGGYYVDLLTEEGERIVNSTLLESLYIQSKTVPASIVTGGVKWMWDGAGEEAMEELRANPPRVCVLDRDYAVWGYPIQDYASDLISFIDENYVPLSDFFQSNIYVLKSYYEEARGKLDSMFGRVTLSGDFPLENDVEISMYLDNMLYSDGRLFISGWAFRPDLDSDEQRTYAVVKRRGELLGVYKTVSYDRLDVANTFGARHLNSGFFSVIDVDGVQDAADIQVMIVVDSNASLPSASEDWRQLGPDFQPAA